MCSRPSSATGFNEIEISSTILFTIKTIKMFKKTMIPVKGFAKKAFSSKRMKSMALMLLVGCGAALAQNSAGDYTAGTTALTTVTEEIVFG